MPLVRRRRKPDFHADLGVGDAEDEEVVRCSVSRSQGTMR